MKFSRLVLAILLVLILALIFFEVSRRGPIFEEEDGESFQGKDGLAERGRDGKPRVRFGSLYEVAAGE